MHTGNPTDLTAIPAFRTAVVYCRISSHGQEDGHGMPRQEEEGRRIASSYGHSNPEVIKDNGFSAYSGENLTAGEFGRFLSRLEHLEAPGVLIVESLDRISRAEPIQAVMTFTTIVNQGWTIHCWIGGRIFNRERLSSNPFLFFEVVMEHQRSNSESKLKHVRNSLVWSSKRDRARTGDRSVPLTRRAPLWLKWIEADPHTGRPGHWQENAERVTIIRRIFRDLLSGMGRDTIARGLNLDGLRPWGHGRLWHGGTVHKITVDRRLLGEMTMHSYVVQQETKPHLKGPTRKKTRSAIGDPILDYFPQIISHEEFRRAEEESKRRAPTKVANPGGKAGTKFTNLFRKMSFCFCCGSPMRRKGGDGHTRGVAKYYCTGIKLLNCKNKTGHNYDMIEKGILFWAANYVRPEPAQRPDNIGRELVALKEKCDRLRTNIKHLYMRAGTDQDAADALDELIKERTKLEARIHSHEIALDKSHLDANRHKNSVQAIMDAQSLKSLPMNEFFRLRSNAHRALSEIMEVIYFDISQFIIITTGGAMQIAFQYSGRFDHSNMNHALLANPDRPEHLAEISARMKYRRHDDISDRDAAARHSRTIRRMAEVFETDPEVQHHRARYLDRQNYYSKTGIVPPAVGSRIALSNLGLTAEVVASAERYCVRRNMTEDQFFDAARESTHKMEVELGRPLAFAMDIDRVRFGVGLVLEQELSTETDRPRPA